MVSIFNEVVQKHVMCCCSGSPNQFIGVYNTSGDNLSTIKYHEGFLGQRIGAASCLAFHPYKVHNSSHLMYFLVLFLWSFHNFLFDSVFFYDELINYFSRVIEFSWFMKLSKDVYVIYVFNLFWWHRFSKSITSTQVYWR